MKKSIFIMAAVILAGIFIPPPAVLRAGVKMVWVAEYRVPGGPVIQGYWRPATKPGYVWVKGHLNRDGNWVPGHWKPVGPAPAGKIWVSGLWIGGCWQAGHWAPVKTGRHWVPGHYGRRGRWRAGHWR